MNHEINLGSARRRQLDDGGQRIRSRGRAVSAHQRGGLAGDQGVTLCLN